VQLKNNGSMPAAKALQENAKALDPEQIQQPAQQQQAQAGARVHYGQDGNSLDEGGKPFKTQFQAKAPKSCSRRCASSRSTAVSL